MWWVLSKTLRNINPQKNTEHKDKNDRGKKIMWKQKRMEKIISCDLICKLYGSLFCLTTKKNIEWNRCLSHGVVRHARMCKVTHPLHFSLHLSRVEKKNQRYVHFFRRGCCLLLRSLRVIPLTNGNKNKTHTSISKHTSRWVTFSQFFLRFSERLNEAKLERFTFVTRLFWSKWWTGEHDIYEVRRLVSAFA